MLVVATSASAVGASVSMLLSTFQFNLLAWMCLASIFISCAFAAPADVATNVENEMGGIAKTIAKAQTDIMNSFTKHIQIVDSKVVKKALNIFKDYGWIPAIAIVVLIFVCFVMPFW